MKITCKPYPVQIEVRFDKTDFTDFGGLCTREGSKIKIDLQRDDFENYYIHETVHAVDMMQQIVETEFDSETRAYWTQLICNKIKRHARTTKANKT